MIDAFILTLSCPDRAGIVHAVTGLLAAQGGNISEAAQFNDQDTGLFFMRVRFNAPGASVATLSAPLAELAASLTMKWQLTEAHARMPTVTMVSKLGHSLNDLLFRYRSQLLPLDIRPSSLATLATGPSVEALIGVFVVDGGRTSADDGAEHAHQRAGLRVYPLDLAPLLRS